MTKLILTFCGLAFLHHMNAQTVSIPDVNFKEALFELGVDNNNDGEFQLLEVQSVDSLNISRREIEDIEGLEFFTSLKYLDLSRNPLSSDPGTFDVNHASIDLNSLIELEYLDCSRSQLIGLDISKLEQLKYLDCSVNTILGIDFSKSLELEHIDCAVNWLGPIPEFDNFKKLKYLNLSSSGIYSIRLKNHLELEDLFIAGNSMSDSDVELENLPKLKGLLCSGNNLNNLVLNNLPSLKIVNAADNSLTKISIYMCDSISSLYLNENRLENLDLTKFPELEVLHCPVNMLETIDLSSSSKLVELGIERNLLEALDVSACHSLRELDVSSNNLKSLDLLQNRELVNLNCNANYIEVLDLNNNVKLEELKCKGTTGSLALKTLRISRCIQLKEMICSSNSLEELDVSQNTKLEELDCSSNQLNNLDVSMLKELTYLYCSDNNISILNVHNSLGLYVLNCSYNVLSELDVSINSNLSRLSIGGNQITHMDISNNIQLKEISIYNDTILEYLNLKNGREIVKNSNSRNEDLFVAFNSVLKVKTICVDDKNTEVMKAYLEEKGVDDVFVSSLCSFIDGGVVFNFSGKAFFSETDNCEDGNLINSRLRYKLKKLDDEQNFFGDENGEFDLFLNRGAYEIKPQVNEDIFAVTPSLIALDLPQDTSLQPQEFCIEAIQDKSDISVSLIPINDARPGFEMSFKMIYENTGSTIVSGIIDLHFQSDYVEYLNSSIDPTQVEQHSLSWAYDDLLPFTSREILVSFKLNSPMDDPPLNGGQILSFKAIGQVIDDSVELVNNVACVELTVVNSFDPNDKTCMEGNSILPEMIGNYVHYKIRFENTGTADAINVIIIDEIDISFFDINSLSVIDASHDYKVVIKNKNELNVIFENINLPFEDEFNDGYVVLKIRTNENLEVNDVIENKADIYFDFNWPIETDVSRSRFELETSIKEIEVLSPLNIFPNPARKRINLISKYRFDVIKLYDSFGRNILSINEGFPILETQLLLPNLPTGIYFIETIGEQNQFSKVLIE